MISWLRNNVINFFVFISYPVRVIPQKKFKREILIEELETLGRIGIVRRSLKSKNETFDKFGSVRQDALIFELKDVPGLSMNLLGNAFKKRHISYISAKDAGKDWDGIEDKLRKKYIRFVTYEINSTPIFFYLNDLHNKPFPYIVPKEKARNPDIQNLIKAFKKRAEGKIPDNQVNGATVIKHCPTKLNYWHVEFRLLDIEAVTDDNVESSITRGNSKWMQKAAENALKDIVLNSAHEKIFNCANINKSIFYQTVD